MFPRILPTVRFICRPGHLAANTVQQSEYEYFYFKKVYGDKFNAGEATSDKSFVDAAWEAVQGENKNVVQIFTTGNRNMGNPFYRPLYPYFNPEAEGNWIAVAGLRKASNFDPANPKYALVDGFNEAGLGKYWTVAAPGNGIYSTIVGKDPKITESKDPLKPAFGSWLWQQVRYFDGCASRCRCNGCPHVPLSGHECEAGSRRDVHHC